MFQEVVRLRDIEDRPNGEVARRRHISKRRHPREGQSDVNSLWARSLRPWGASASTAPALAAGRTTGSEGATGASGDGATAQRRPRVSAEQPASPTRLAVGGGTPGRGHQHGHRLRIQRAERCRSPAGWPPKLRIPVKSITHSDGNRSPIPTETDHRRSERRGTWDHESRFPRFLSPVGVIAWNLPSCRAWVDVSTGTDLTNARQRWARSARALPDLSMKKMMGCGRCAKPRFLRFCKLLWARSLRPWERRRPQPPAAPREPCSGRVVGARTQRRTRVTALGSPDPAVPVVLPPVICRSAAARDCSHESGFPVRVEGRRRFRIESPFRSSL